MNEILIISLIVLLLLLDLATVAGQTVLLQASLPRILLLHEQAGKKVDRTVGIIQLSLQAQASLNLARLLWRFSLAGLILYLSLQLGTPYSLLIGIGVLLYLHWH